MAHPVIGSGVYAQVLQVTRAGKRYALKREPNDVHGAPSASAVREAYIVSQSRHPNIVPLHDAYFSDTDGSSTNLLLAAGEDGNVWQWLQQHPSEQQLLQVLVDIIQGVAFLHDQQIIHGDLKPPNIVINQNRAWLIDFGLSRREVGQQRFGAVQTVSWRAPEAFLTKTYTKAIDMWSVGCLIWDLFAGSKDRTLIHPADEDFSDANVLNTLVRTLYGRGISYQQALKLGIPPAVGLPMKANVTSATRLLLEELMRACLDVDPRTRITADQALNRLGSARVAGSWLTSTARNIAPVTDAVAACYQLIWQQFSDDLSPETYILMVDIAERAMVGESWPASDNELLVHLLAALYLAAAVMEDEIVSLDFIVDAIEEPVTHAAIADRCRSICQALDFKLYADNLTTACADKGLRWAITMYHINQALPPALELLYAASDWSALISLAREQRLQW